MPTIAESGLPGFDYNLWVGLFAPAAMPPEIVDKINKDVQRALASPEIKERLANLGAEPMPMTPAEFRAFTRNDVEDVARRSSRPRASRDSSGCERAEARGPAKWRSTADASRRSRPTRGPLGVCGMLAEAEVRDRPTRYIVTLTEPPSMTRFWPMMNPASALQRNAHALPNSSGVPKRPAGFSATRAARNVS